MNTVLIVSIALLILNLVSFSLMAYDKHCAKAGKWRVSEKASLSLRPVSAALAEFLE